MKATTKTNVDPVGLSETKTNVDPVGLSEDMRRALDGAVDEIQMDGDSDTNFWVRSGDVRAVVIFEAVDDD